MSKPPPVDPTTHVPPAPTQPEGSTTALRAEAGLTTVWQWAEDATESSRPRPEGGRYDDRGPIGSGGMGEVRRVWDDRLNRMVAMKLLRTDLVGLGGPVARFVEEAQTTAQLQHPNIVPVHDLGHLPGGRQYFTMKEVHGRTFGEVVAEVHAAAARGERRSATGWTFRRLVSALHLVVQAVAFAHERGVVHRDLKPANVLVGDLGEVQVMDWGLAKIVGTAEYTPEVVVTDRSGDDAGRTRAGAVMGTPAFMSPEQARGENDRIDARSDVYALGAMLYVTLSGQQPYAGKSGRETVAAVIAGPPDPPRAADGTEPPEELADICRRAMARAPEDRYPSARALADALEAWLDGSQRRERALALVERAAAVVPRAAALRARAAERRAEGEAALATLARWASEEDKAPAWALQDEASDLERQAALEELERERLLAAALEIDAELPEAHEVLASDLLERHASAEEARDDEAAARAAARLRVHVAALPPVRRARFERYLDGAGTLTLIPDAPASVSLFRYELRRRRLVAVPFLDLGVGPVRDLALPRGSYLAVLRAPGRAEVRYPVWIGRNGRWDGVPPGESEPEPIHLPPADALGPDDRYVPAGWAWVGGPAAGFPLPRRRVWCDGFVLRRFPVTNTQYLAFLDDLAASGRLAEALAYAPCERAGAEDEVGAQIYGRDAQGRFALRPDADGDLWDPEWPVVMVDWYGARAYAAWEAARTGLPWRLPGELEWEKAARGVDGRLYPWGDHVDPSWANTRESGARPLPAVVDAWPVDESVYGVRGCGGNVMDWCEDGFRRDGPALVGDRVPPPDPDGADRVFRGGCWDDLPHFGRCAMRLRFAPSYRFGGLGFRLARSL